MFLRLDHFPCYRCCVSLLLLTIVGIPGLILRWLSWLLTVLLSVSPEDRGHVCCVHHGIPDPAVSPAHHALWKVSEGEKGGQGWSSQRGRAGPLLHTSAQIISLSPGIILTGRYRSPSSHGDLQNVVILPRPQVRKQGCEWVARKKEPQVATKYHPQLKGWLWVRGAALFLSVHLWWWALGWWQTHRALHLGSPWVWFNDLLTPSWNS